VSKRGVVQGTASRAQRHCGHCLLQRIQPGRLGHDEPVLHRQGLLQVHVLQVGTFSPSSHVACNNVKFLNVLDGKIELHTGHCILHSCSMCLPGWTSSLTCLSLLHVFDGGRAFLTVVGRFDGGRAFLTVVGRFDGGRAVQVV